MRGRLAAGLAAVALVTLAGRGEDDRLSAQASLERLDAGDTLVTQGVEIVDGRFVPDLVAVDAAQPVWFVNRDDVTHSIVKVSGPGQDFRSGPLRPGDRYRLSLVGRLGYWLREGTVVYRSARAGNPTGRIEVTGMLLRRLDPSERPPDA
jgi:plastocyanin